MEATSRTGYAGYRAVSALAAAGRRAQALARAPGRLNLIGEHVDYNGGFVLPVAIDRHIAVAAAGRMDGRIRVVAADLGETREFEAGAHDATRRGWWSYIEGVAALLAEYGLPFRGADLAVSGDVPRGVGLSSSAALTVSSSRALLALARCDIEASPLAAMCRRVEVEFAGVSCGIMDPFASVAGRAGHAIFLDCRSLEHEHVPLPSGVRLVATDSGIRRGLQDSPFNDRVRECREAAALLGVAELRDVTPAHLAASEAALPEPQRRRARHVVHEIERVRRAADALRDADPVAVGSLMAESHAGLRDDYEVSTPELECLVAAARALPGVYGSRISGAGFGGCTVSLVDAGAVDVFRREVTAAYRRETGRAAMVHVCSAADGASTEPCQ